MRYWIDIIEGVSDHHLYHGTHILAAIDIINDRRIISNTTHPSKWLGLPTREGIGKTRGISLTRSFRVAEGFSEEKIVFVLDWEKLRQTYPIKQIDYYYNRYQGQLRGNQSPNRRVEDEEFVITKTGIPLDRYLVEIRIGRPGLIEAPYMETIRACNFPVKIIND